MLLWWVLVLFQRNYYLKRSPARVLRPDAVTFSEMVANYTLKKIKHVTSYFKWNSLTTTVFRNLSHFVGQSERAKWWDTLFKILRIRLRNSMLNYVKPNQTNKHFIAIPVPASYHKRNCCWLDSRSGEWIIYISSLCK